MQVSNNSSFKGTRCCSFAGSGASIAKHLAAEGAAVIVNYASSKTDADRVVAEINEQGGSSSLTARGLR